MDDIIWNFLVHWFKWAFLTLEIRSKEGVLHFRRWRLLRIPLFRIYVHEIYQADQDHHRHSHPWNFAGLILAGGYEEAVYDGTLIPNPLGDGVLGSSYGVMTRVVGPWTWNVKTAGEFHKIERLLDDRSVSIVFAWGRYRDWGYITERGFVDKDTYRILKRGGVWDRPEEETPCVPPPPAQTPTSGIRP